VEQARSGPVRGEPEEAGAAPASSHSTDARSIALAVTGGLIGLLVLISALACYLTPRVRRWTSQRFQRYQDSEGMGERSTPSNTASGGSSPEVLLTSVKKQVGRILFKGQNGAMEHPVLHAHQVHFGTSDNPHYPAVEPQQPDNPSPADDRA